MVVAFKKLLPCVFEDIVASHVRGEKMSSYINREEALSYPFANGKYDKKNASMEFIFGCEAYKEWLETLDVKQIEDDD